MLSPGSGHAPSCDPPALPTALHGRMARLESAGRARHRDQPVPVCDGLPLTNGGLARAALHYVLGTSPGAAAGRLERNVAEAARMGRRTAT